MYLFKFSLIALSASWSVGILSMSADNLERTHLHTVACCGCTVIRGRENNTNG